MPLLTIPIILGNTIYKLYANCKAKWMTNWIEECDVMSPNQKGFLPHEDVFENNFILDHFYEKLED